MSNDAFRWITDILLLLILIVLIVPLVRRVP
jgi:hypothetical protein